MCEHITVLEIYKDGTHKEVSHYRCTDCGSKIERSHGKRIIKSPIIGINDNIIECKIGPVCPACGTIASYIDDILWFFNYKSCSGCGRNFVARKTKNNPMFESKWRMN